jgi:hypothetical protein
MTFPSKEVSLTPLASPHSSHSLRPKLGQDYDYM